MSGRLEGLVALVTGAGRGLGRAVAIEMAREGASVVVNDLGAAATGERVEPDRALGVVEEIRAFGGTAIVDRGDVGELDDAERMISLAIDTWGKLDVLVNNAGIIRLGTIVDTDPEDFDAVLRVHLRGYFNTTRAAARHWVARRRYGRLINFASGSSLVSQPSLLAYSVAKTGVLGFTRSSANALAPYSVTANCIRPAAATGMADISPESRIHLERTGRTVSEDAVGTDLDPAHVTPLIVYLASPAAGHVSGRLFEGRGGRYVRWSEPHEERVVERNFLAEPDEVYAEIDRVLCADLQLTDLPMPMAPLHTLGDWRDRFGVRVPLWDGAMAVPEPDPIVE